MPSADFTDASGGLPWHQALAYALLGRVEPRLGRQDRPEVGLLIRDLEATYAGGHEGLAAELDQARSAPSGWPFVVPDQLRAGLGAAQFAAAFTELRRLLGIDVGDRRTLSSRAPDAAEQALLREVPPHY